MKAKIVSFERLKGENIFLKVQPNENFDFKAGQFFMIKIGKDEKPFSIASFPGENTIDFLISVHPDGTVTPKLNRMNVGDSFEIEGPYGVFNVRDTNAKEIFFIAAGTGIAPFRSMIMEALQRFPKKKVKLIFGFRDVFYFEHFWKELESSYKNFSLVPCCTKPEKNWKGNVGRVTSYLEKEIKNAKDKEVYICGPPQMVMDTRIILENRLGFDKEKIYVEKW